MLCYFLFFGLGGQKICKMVADKVLHLFLVTHIWRHTRPYKGLFLSLTYSRTVLKMLKMTSTTLDWKKWMRFWLLLHYVN